MYSSRNTNCVDIELHVAMFNDVAKLSKMFDQFYANIHFRMCYMGRSMAERIKSSALSRYGGP